jgi:hypothetical protein
VERYFGDMVKVVVDVRLKTVAAGGELHADAERLLLERGSRQEDLWGANYYPGKGKEDCIEYTALIDIRPSRGNRSMEIADDEIRRTIQEVTHQRIGEGEVLQVASQHSSLTEEKWLEFTLDQQILMIGNEMNRGKKLLDSADIVGLRNCYERILTLTDLTIRVNTKSTLRRELLRWRDLIAELFLSSDPDRRDHMAAFQLLLLLTPEASKQRPYVL